jgi:hypothetical protein
VGLTITGGGFRLPPVIVFLAATPIGLAFVGLAASTVVA